MRRYFLVGMPSSGKSTIGKALAAQLELPFHDVDTAIETKEGKSIPALFREEGEPYFRSAEAEALRSVTHSHPAQIIATGGGAPLFHDNMDFMKEHGVVIFLNVSVEELGKRLQASNVADRPLVQALGDDSFMEALRDKHKKRLPFYRQAHIHVFDDALQVPKVLEALREMSYL